MPIFMHTLRGFRWPMLFVGLGLFGYSFLLCYTFKAFGGGEGLGQFLKALPSGLQSLVKAFGFVEPTAIEYVANGYRDLRYLIILTGFAIGNAASAFAGEIERGTVLYLLARPISRTSVVLQKMTALAVAIVALIATGFVGSALGAMVNGFADQVPLGRLLSVQVMVFALVWLVASISLMFSARSNDRGLVLAVSAGLFVTLYFLEFLTAIWPAAEPLGTLTPFHYFDPVVMVGAGAFPWRDFAILSAGSLVASGLAVLVFQRRDITR